MNRSGPVVIIEDDADDQEVLTQVFEELGYKNKVEFFYDGDAALAYLNKTDIIPFLILSDVNMPRLNGIALREKITENANLQVKCIPFIFFSTSAEQKTVIKAYSASAQGFFIKDHTYNEILDTISVIMKYWYKCSAPNNYLDEK